MPATDLWLRRCSLWVMAHSIPTFPSDEGIDLSDFRIRFQTHQADIYQAVPPWVWIRVSNLKPETEKRFINEYQSVILQAGYQRGKFGVIFAGQIKQFKRGHESPTDTYLDIYAAAGDPAFNFAVCNKTLSAQGSVAQAALDELNKYGLPKGYIDPAAQVALQAAGIRGQVAWGMAHRELSLAGRQAGWTWTTDLATGKINIVPLTGYLPQSEAVVLSASTGMVGWPEQTQEGINVVSLLNPALRVQGLVQIDNRDINQTQAPGGGFTVSGFPALSQITRYQPTSDDGIYRILVLEHEGDTRGNPWYSKMVCILTDQSVVGTVATSPQGDVTDDHNIPVPPPLNSNLPAGDPPIEVDAAVW